MGYSAPVIQTTYTGQGGLGTTNLSITVGAGSNQVLVIIVTTGTTSFGSTPTWNGSSTGVTFVNSVTNGSNQITGIWYLKNPTQTIANVSYPGTNNTGINAYLLNSVDLSSPVGTNGTNVSASVATSQVTITTSRDNSIVISGIGTPNAVDLVTTGTNQTLGTNVNMGSGNPRMADSSQTTTTAGSYTQGFSIGGGTATRTLVSVEIQGIYSSTAYTSSVSDSVMNGASRSSTIARVVGFNRTTSDLIMNAASRLTTIIYSRGYTRAISDSIMNGASRFVTFITSFVHWGNTAKSSTGWNNNTRDNSTFSNNSKSASTWTDKNKS